MNLLRQLIELRKMVYLLNYQFTIKKHNSEQLDGSIGQGMGDEEQRPHAPLKCDALQAPLLAKPGSPSNAFAFHGFSWRLR